MVRLRVTREVAQRAQEREVALAVLADMRRKHLSLTAAARARQTTPAVVRRHVGSAIKRNTNRGHRVAPFDRFPRRLNVLTADGQRVVTVRDSRTASRIGAYQSALGAYLRTGRTAALEAFRHRSFRADGVTYRFITDVDTLDRLGRALDLAIDGLYHAIPGMTR